MLLVVFVFYFKIIITNLQYVDGIKFRFQYFHGINCFVEILFCAFGRVGGQCIAYDIGVFQIAVLRLHKLHKTGMFFVVGKQLVRYNYSAFFCSLNLLCIRYHIFDNLFGPFTL